VSATAWVVVGTALILLFWGVGAHNRLVALRNAVAEAWAELEEALQRRATAVAPLVSSLREGLAGEGAALDALLTAQARITAAADALRPRPVRAEPAQALVLAESALASAQARVLALLDLQPELRDQPDVAPHVALLRETEPRIVFRRQRFNAAAHTYNDAVRQWPTKLMARLYGFGTAGLL
jgi:LemA protein